MSDRLALAWRCVWPSWNDGEEARALALLAARPPGAITLFRRHLPSLEQTLDLNRRVLMATGGKTRIAVDEEGGPVRRMPAPFPAFPAGESWSQNGAGEATVTASHRSLGEALGAFGFAIDFAPVADLCFDANHPALKGRCFAREPATAARYVAAAVRGLQAAGLNACAKHFPGHGAVALDSHHDLDTLQRSVSDVQAAEFVPFRAAIAADVALIMAAHFKWPSLDAVQPTTFSTKLIDRLRRDLGFRGVVLTDDLEMGAIAAHWDKAEAALLALAAGYDAVLYCKSIEAAEAAAAIVAREAERSPAFRDHLRAAAARIDKLAQVPSQQLVQADQIGAALVKATWAA